LAKQEDEKRKTIKGYRSTSPVLKKLANSRMELLLKGKPVRFDANDLSTAYASVIKAHYAGNRKAAEEYACHRLIKLLHLESAYRNNNLLFVVKNWCVLLMANEKLLRSDKALQQQLKKMFLLKANGSEEEYLQEMRKGKVLSLLDFVAQPNENFK
jgi:thiol:disulfide interchange protein